MQDSGIKAPFSYRLSPVGQCIYCGTTDGRLTKEHIVPEGMGGTLILPEASCDPCAEITSRFELNVMKGFMDRGRKALGVKGKKKKRSPPPEVTHTTTDALGVREQVLLPFAQAWRTMSFPLLPIPRVMDPGKDISPIDATDLIGLHTLHFGADKLHGHTSARVTGVEVKDKIDLTSFMRSLAKIAHGYHIAIYGNFPINESPLIPIILGSRMDARNWIGGTEEVTLPSDREGLHLLATTTLTGDDGSQATAVLIKLFAAQQTPTYVAITRIPSLSPMAPGESHK